jgi:hypothetical protein
MMGDAQKISSQEAGDMQNLIQAYLLESRGVIQLSGEGGIEALQPLVTNSLASLPAHAYVLDEDGYLLADLFIVRHEDSVLVECDKSIVAALLELLAPSCDAFEAVAKDVTDRWRVFAELPDQSTSKDGLYIKYVDPRWHMGARLLRPITNVQSSQWGREIKWETHAFKLGVLPGVQFVRDLSVGPLEANLHAMGVLDAKRVSEAVQSDVAAPGQIGRRILPMRVEPDNFSFPTMTGLSVTAGDTPIATVIGHHGLYALALVDLDPWRAALQQGLPLQCAGQTVLLTWPTWLALESRGRYGPAATVKP